LSGILSARIALCWSAVSAVAGAVLYGMFHFPLPPLFFVVFFFMLVCFSAFTLYKSRIGGNIPKKAKKNQTL